jgi:hypothetical protein
MEQQEKIGWRHFVRGRLAGAWGTLTHQHIEENSLKGTCDYGKQRSSRSHGSMSYYYGMHGMKKQMA